MTKIAKSRALQTEISASDVRKRIYTLKRCQVMLDQDLAEIYGVELKLFKQAVRRNMERFPRDFMWAASEDELESLRSQSIISNGENSGQGHRANFELHFEAESTEACSEADSRPSFESQFDAERSAGSIGRRGSRYTSFVFAEPGAAMLASVLHSPRAIQVSIGIIRLFIQLRGEQRCNPDVMPKLESLETMLKQRLDQLEARLQNPTPTIPSPPKLDALRVILKHVARHFGLTSEDLKSASRAQPIGLARQVAVFFMRKHLGMGFSEIGRHLGGRDHSTILHAYRKIHVDSEDNDTVRKAVMTLLNEIQPLLV